MRTKKRGCLKMRRLFLCLQKNRASPNFAQSELARLPNFLYLRESSQDIPKIMFKSYTSNDNLLLPPCLGDFIPQNDPVRVVHRIIEQINLEKLYRRYFSPRLFCIPPSHDASDSGLCLSA